MELLTSTKQYQTVVTIFLEPRAQKPDSNKVNLMRMRTGSLDVIQIGY
jgi:hypothetical protein